MTVETEKLTIEVDLLAAMAAARERLREADTTYEAYYGAWGRMGQIFEEDIAGPEDFRVENPKEARIRFWEAVFDGVREKLKAMGRYSYPETEDEEAA